MSVAHGSGRHSGEAPPKRALDVAGRGAATSQDLHLTRPPYRQQCIHYEYLV